MRTELFIDGVWRASGDRRVVAVENPDALTSRTFRHVRVQFPDAAALLPTYRALETMAGVENLRIEGTAVLFDAHGDLNPIMRLIAGTEIAGIDIERPSLEEVFLTYYTGATRSVAPVAEA